MGISPSQTSSSIQYKMTMETLIMTKLSNKTLHELGMIDDSTQDEFTFESLADEYAVERKKKYKNSRKYSAEKSAQYRARRLAKKAREERIAIESGAVEALYHQQSYNKEYDNGEPIS